MTGREVGRGRAGASGGVTRPLTGAVRRGGTERVGRGATGVGVVPQAGLPLAGLPLALDDGRQASPTPVAPYRR